MEQDEVFFTEPSVGEFLTLEQARYVVEDGIAYFVDATEQGEGVTPGRVKVDLSQFTGSKQFLTGAVYKVKAIATLDSHEYASYMPYFAKQWKVLPLVIEEEELGPVAVNDTELEMNATVARGVFIGTADLGTTAGEAVEVNVTVDDFVVTLEGNPGELYPGTYTIKVDLAENTFEFTPVDVPAAAITINDGATTVQADESKTVQLVATIVPAYSTTQGVTWRSSDEEMATVDENGLVTIVGGNNVSPYHRAPAAAPGVTATITATAADNGWAGNAPATSAIEVTYQKPTAIAQIERKAEVVDVKYVNTLGMESNKPFDGMNIVVTTLADGSVTTVKIIK